MGSKEKKKSGPKLWYALDRYDPSKLDYLDILEQCMFHFIGYTVKLMNCCCGQLILGIMFGCTIMCLIDSLT